MVKPWLQCLALLWGAGCSMSRITDHRHHWWDVAVGVGLGIAFAVFVVRVMCKCFRGGSSVELTPVNGAAPPGGFAAANKRHQSVKKLLSNSSAVELPEGRELGDMPAAWTA